MYHHQGKTQSELTEESYGSLNVLSACELIKHPIKPSGKSLLNEVDFKHIRETNLINGPKSNKLKFGSQ